MNERQQLLKEKYNGDSSEAYQADLVRLASGEPLAYIIGSIPFENALIYLDSRPLIPRSETEFWTHEAIQKMKSFGEEIAVLDLCAGSGCIGVSVLVEMPKARVDFVESISEHHPTILKNIEKNIEEKDRARVFGGDLFEQVHTMYDFILSNPPYIDPLLDRIQDSVREYEPHTALYGGRGGMELLERIVREAPTYLTPSGVMYLEHEPEQLEPIHALAEEHFGEVESYKDQYGVYRFTRFARRNRLLMQE